MGARPVAGRARPPSATLAVASTCSLARSFSSLLRPLVLSPSPSSSSPSFPHFLLPHYLAPRAPVPAEPAPFRTFFDDKMTIVDLLTPRSSSYKVILISLFLLVGLVFRFVFYTTSTRASFPISFRQYYRRRQESLYLEDLEGPSAVNRPRRHRCCHCRHCHCCRHCRRWRFRQPRQPRQPSEPI